MKLRTAILKAAKHIETHPKLFDFGTIEIPHTCKTPGCALGWMHYFSKVGGIPGADGDVIEASHFTGLSGDQDFYSRVDDLYGGCGWRYDAAECGLALRLFADDFAPKTTSDRAGVK